MHYYFDTDKMRTMLNDRQGDMMTSLFAKEIGVAQQSLNRIRTNQPISVDTFAACVNYLKAKPEDFFKQHE